MRAWKLERFPCHKSHWFKFVVTSGLPFPMVLCQPQNKQTCGCWLKQLERNPNLPSARLLECAVCCLRSAHQRPVNRWAYSRKTVGLGACALAIHCQRLQAGGVLKKTTTSSSSSSTTTTTTTTYHQQHHHHHYYCHHHHHHHHYYHHYYRYYSCCYYYYCYYYYYYCYNYYYY